VVHPTDHERSSGDRGSTIARLAPATSDTSQPADTSSKLGSLELGAMVPFPLETARVHLAPGVRIFDSHPGSVLFGVAVGADFFGNGRGPGFALEGSVHAGNSGPDPTLIVQAVDLFAGVTLRPARTPMSVAVGPSLGILGMPGGQSVVMLGLGLRVTSGSKRSSRAE
jgi:hypothetical protein